MMRVSLGIIILGLVTACASGGSATGLSENSGQAPVAQVDAQALNGQGETNNATAGAEEKVVCRTERSTGSHFSRKVCRTERQMDEDREAARDLMENQPMIGAPASN